MLQRGKYLFWGCRRTALQYTPVQGCSTGCSFCLVPFVRLSLCVLCFTVGWAGLAALAQTGQVDISDPSQSPWLFWAVLLGCGDQVGGVEHRREQGAGAASQGTLWVAGQEQPLPPAGGLSTSPPKPSLQAPSGLWGCKQLSSGHSALFSYRYSFPYCFQLISIIAAVNGNCM